MTMAAEPASVTLLDALSRSRSSLTGGDLRLGPEQLSESVTSLAASLAARGAQPDRPICYLPPSGAMGAVAFLASAIVGAAAPVNPKLTAAELNHYVEALDPSLVIVTPDRQDAIEAISGRPVDVWSWDTHSLEIAGVSSAGDASGLRPGPDDVALILPTSGTTGLPKQVPLTHRKLSTSAHNIASWLKLDEADTSLTLMPLFHIHGLVAGLLAPLLRSGTVAVEPFDAFGFGGHMEHHRPSWFSAVPTMHAMIVERWARRASELAGHRLRFVRASSSALHPDLLRDMETLFGVPAAEAYGMTEASHQIAANPIAPGERRPGTVGVPTGTEVKILNPDVAGRGEVIVRAPQVTDGYRNRDDANAEAFIDGWFRTGDEGYLDDGWLSLTGRLKEMINRGGEKISPIEVETQLSRIAGVRRCVAFGAPHETLGEDVIAAVVAEDGTSLDQGQIRTELRKTLAAHKVPSRILAVGEIPLGPTGKVQRSRLAHQLGL